MRSIVFGALLAASLALSPAFAQAPDRPDPETSKELLEDATRKILDAFELMLKAIPQYEAPKILENGDIIIRRKRPGSEKPAPKPAPGKDGPTRTRT